MNQLIKRKSPEYIAIPDSFIALFEFQVIESYISRVEDRAFLDWHLPDLEKDMLLNDAIDPRVQVAAYMGFTAGDKNRLNTFLTEDRTVHNIFEDYSAHYWELEDHPDQLFLNRLYADIKTFMDFHHMSYIDRYLDTVSEPVKGRFYKNLPIGKVW